MTNMHDKIIDNEWGKEFFNSLYWNLFMKRDAKEVRREAELIQSLANLKPEHSVLDVCCGVGDIAHHLSKNIKTAKGIEWSDDYAKIAHSLFPHFELIHDNALTVQIEQKFDVVYNWYSSFSYFDNVNNKKLLANCSHWLKSDGLFLLECYNPYQVLQNFKEDIYYENHYNDKTYHIHRKSELDWKLRRLNQFWTITDENQQVQRYDTFTLLYMIDEMFEMLGKHFYDITILGRNQDGEIEDFSIYSPRYIITARKKD
jgi:SAM-dependent methyltransferase